MKITGTLVDLHLSALYKAAVIVENGKIASITKTDDPVDQQFILPGFIDAHVHIESSMLVPTEFARMAVVHGSVATISDPHEIGNVLGVPGVEYLIENGKKSPFKFYFGAPSCVPATTFETAGAVISSADVDYLMAKPEVKYLAEMMNWPGVLFKDPVVYEKIAIAQKYNKPVDGHAPGLLGEDAEKYIAAGISTDHECFTYEEGLGKLKRGMKVLIREGSAAKNYEALADLIPEFADLMMFCSDDKHPDSLLEGHINLLVKRSLAKGFGLFKVLRMACVNPVEHYNLEVGLLREGDAADFIIVDNLENFGVKQTFIDGKLVAENGVSKLSHQAPEIVNKFGIGAIDITDLNVSNEGASEIPVIEVLDRELITNRLNIAPKVENGFLVSDVERDILKIVVVNRYHQSEPAVAFIKNFGIKEGAIASSVAHDSHNIIAVGADDGSITAAINLVISSKGGLSAVNRKGSKTIPLPIAGLMSDADGYKVAEDYTKIDEMVKNEMGSTLTSPFMSLSFMALLVIPALKLSDLGLFDGEKFEFV